MRKVIPTRFVSERITTPADIQEGVRLNSDLATDPNGFPVVFGSRPSSESIAIVVADNRMYWDIDDTVIADYPLYGRPFVHTVFDCYTFLKDYFNRVYNIPLPTVSYEDNWWGRGDDHYKNHIDQAGFEVVNPPIQVGDVIAMKVMSPVINHTAVYLGGGEIAHHMPERASKKEKFRPAYLRMTSGYYRHKDLSQ
jgi:cell wall-associated NlpC family hydrolase